MKSLRVMIVNVDWLDQDGLEAEVQFEILGKELWAFCHPCKVVQGEMQDVRIEYIEEDVDDSAFWNETSERRKCIKPSSSNRCRYYCFGQVESIGPVVIDCGVLKFDYGDWLNDQASIGQYVYFVISRLDLVCCGK